MTRTWLHFPFTINMNENGKLVTDRYFAHRNEDTINVELDLQEINTQDGNQIRGDITRDKSENKA